jgi:hypothetical protein
MTNMWRDKMGRGAIILGAATLLFCIGLWITLPLNPEAWTIFAWLTIAGTLALQVWALTFAVLIVLGKYPRSKK